MEEVTVCYSNATKAGIYIEFRLPIHVYSLEDMNAYDRFLKKNIDRQFGALKKKYGLEFSTDSSYIVTEDGETYLLLCLCGEKNKDLDRELNQMGIPEMNPV